MNNSNLTVSLAAALRGVVDGFGHAYPLRAARAALQEYDNAQARPTVTDAPRDSSPGDYDEWRAEAIAAGQFMASLRTAAWNNEGVTLARGDFTPKEIRLVIAYVEALRKRAADLSTSNAELLRALRDVMPYVESRLEDMEEGAKQPTAHDCPHLARARERFTRAAVLTDYPRCDYWEGSDDDEGCAVCGDAADATESEEEMRQALRDDAREPDVPRADAFSRLGARPWDTHGGDVITDAHGDAVALVVMDGTGYETERARMICDAVNAYVPPQGG